MATTTEELLVVLKANNKELVAALKQSDSAIDTHKGKTESLSGTVAGLKTSYLAAAAAIYGAAKTLAGFVQEAMAAELAEKKLDNILRQTGYAAGLTTQEMLEMAGSLSKVTTNSTGTYVEAQGLLATFTSIGRDVFPQALEAAADMSEMFGTDLKTAVQQMGSALNDPIQGMTRLRRVGIVFTDEQKELVQELVNSNDVMGAQKVILDELSSRFGGSARAATDTFAGKVKQINNLVGDMKETIGFALIDAIDPMTEGIRDFLGESENIEFVNDLVRTLVETFMILFNIVTFGLDGWILLFDVARESLTTMVETGVLVLQGKFTEAFEALKSGSFETFEAAKSHVVLWGDKAKAVFESAKNIHRAWTTDHKKEIDKQRKDTIAAASADMATEKERADVIKSSEAALAAFKKEALQQGVKSFVDAAASDKATLGSVMGGMADVVGNALVTYLEQMAVIYLTAGNLVLAGAATAAAVTAKVVFSGLSKSIKASAMAEGGSGIVDRPTLFLAGEAGPEHYNFTPVGREGQMGGGLSVGEITINAPGGDPQIVKEAVVEALREIYDDAGMSSPLRAGAVA